MHRGKDQIHGNRNGLHGKHFKSIGYQQGYASFYASSYLNSIQEDGLTMNMINVI